MGGTTLGVLTGWVVTAFSVGLATTLPVTTALTAGFTKGLRVAIFAADLAVGFAATLVVSFASFTIDITSGDPGWLNNNIVLLLICLCEAPEIHRFPARQESRPGRASRLWERLWPR